MYQVYEVSETIKVTKETKRSLVRVAAALQQETGTRVSLDQTIKHLLHLSREKRAELLETVFGSIPQLSVKNLRRERTLDEERTRRKLGA